MADIRIKDLATTASTTASDDFMAVDGTTNGTRKLSAATPSFATSVTVPGVSGPTATNLTLAGGSSGASLVLGNSTAASVKVIPTTSGSVLLGNITPSLYDTNGAADVSQFWNFKSSMNVGAGTAGYAQGAVAATSFYGGWRTNSTGSPIIAAYNIVGMLSNTAGSETGYMDVATKPSTGAAAVIARWTPTGNLLIGTTTDISGTGGLHVAGTGTATSSSNGGALRVGTNVAMSGNAGGASYFGGTLQAANIVSTTATGTTLVQISDTAAGGKAYSLISAGTGNVHGAAAGTFYLRNSSDNTTIWSLTSSGDATFAGTGTATSSSNGGALRVGTNVAMSGNAGGASYFGGNLTVGTGAAAVASVLNRGTTAQSSLAQWQTASAANWSVGSGATGTNTNLEFYNHNTASSNLTLNYTTGAATFAGAVTGKLITTQADDTSSGFVVKRSANPYIDFYDGGTSGTIRAEISATNDGVSGGTLVFAPRNAAGTITTALTLTKDLAATFAGAVAIGNTVNTVSPTSPNRTVTMVIGGVTYYLAAKTTND